MINRESIHNDFSLYCGNAKKALDLAYNTLSMHYNTYTTSKVNKVQIKALIDESMEHLMALVLDMNYDTFFCNCDGEKNGCSTLFCLCKTDYVLVERLNIVREHFKSHYILIHNAISDGWVQGIMLDEIKELVDKTKELLYAEKDSMMEVLDSYCNEIDECEDITIKKSYSIPEIKGDYAVDGTPTEKCNVATNNRFLVKFPSEMGIVPSMVSGIQLTDYPSKHLTIKLREMWTEDSTDCLPYVLTKYIDDEIPFDMSVSILDGNLNTKYCIKYQDVVMHAFRHTYEMRYNDDNVVEYEVLCDFLSVEYLSENGNVNNETTNKGE